MAEMEGQNRSSTLGTANTNEGKLDVLRVAITASLRKASQDRANGSQSGKIQYASSRHHLEHEKSSGHEEI
jgi:hypothetical protein